MTIELKKYFLIDSQRQCAHQMRVQVRCVSGFSLIEVLVALLVLSIGLLGLASLQTFGLKYSMQSYQRTQAIYQAYDILDRIRANRQGRLNGGYSAVTLGATPTITVNCEANACNPDQLAIYDINKWNTSNNNLLAQGKGSISIAGSRCIVTISWVEGDLPANVVMEVDL